MLEKKEDNNQIIHEVKYYKNSNLLFEWTDKFLAEDYFVRSIGNSTYHFKQGEVILIRTNKKTTPISKTKVDKVVYNRILTMDFETILINNIHTPYLLTWYDGNISKSYFIKDLNKENLENNIFEMVKNAMDDICIDYYRKHIIYMHNFSWRNAYLMDIF